MPEKRKRTNKTKTKQDKRQEERKKNESEKSSNFCTFRDCERLCSFSIQ